MSDCPHCRRFREERDEAVEALRQAKENARGGADAARRIIVAFRNTPHRVGPQEARLLAALYATPGLASRDELIAALRTEGDPEIGLKTKISHLRRAGFSIECVPSFGYVLANESRAVIRDALAAVAREAAA